MIIVADKRQGKENIRKMYPNAVILDVTSTSNSRYGQVFSPFFPHRNIPIPGDSGDLKATCVEAIWQGLKVFENADIDKEMFHNDTMRNLKRSSWKYGRVIGHRYGVFSEKIMKYADAKKYIYLPAYKFVLDNIPEVHDHAMELKRTSRESDIVLLDYNLNPDNLDLTRPLSHAELLKMYIEDRYPSD